MLIAFDSLYLANQNSIILLLLYYTLLLILIITIFCLFVLRLALLLTCNHSKTIIKNI